MSATPAAILALALAASCVVPGCTGRADLHITALNFRDIDPPPPHSAVRMDRCCWWLDEQQRLWIAMERRISTPLGADFALSFRLSIELRGLPAGEARNYLAGRQELRAVAEAGPLASRFASTEGIIALYRAPGDRLRGSLRLEVVRQNNTLLGGWSRPTRYLLTGTFEAVHDPQRGPRMIPAAEQPDSDADRGEPAGAMPSPGGWHALASRRGPAAP